MLDGMINTLNHKEQSSPYDAEWLAVTAAVLAAVVAVLIAVGWIVSAVL